MRKLAVFLILVLVFLSGCDFLQTEDGRPLATDYRQGVARLEIENLESLPPKEIFEGSNFRIALRLRNRGAYDISRGTVEIAGLDSKYVLLEPKKKDLEPVEGRSVTNTEGGFYIEEFNGQILRNPEKAKEYRANYYVIANYDYRSEMQEEVCINTNLYSDLSAGEADCRPEQTITMPGQGAPIAITKIEQVIIPEDNGANIVYKFYLENKGRGFLTSPIYMEETRLSHQRLVCEQNFVEYKENKDNFFVCSVFENREAAYTAPVYAAVYYSYQTVEENNFLIKKV